MKTTAETYPVWMSDTRLFFKTKEEVSNIEYKFLKIHSDSKNVIWERSNNRSLDLSQYFKDKKFSHIVIEDVAFDNTKAKPEIKLIYGEGALEADSLI